MPPLREEPYAYKIAIINSCSNNWNLKQFQFEVQWDYLGLLILGAAARGAGRKAWPPTLPPVLAAEASWTDPSVNTPAANVTTASFANWFVLLLYSQHPKHNFIKKKKRKRKIKYKKQKKSNFVWLPRKRSQRNGNEIKCFKFPHWPSRLIKLVIIIFLTLNNNNTNNKGKSHLGLLFSRFPSSQTRNFINWAHYHSFFSNLLTNFGFSLLFLGF